MPAGLGDDLAHPQQRAALEALDDRQHVGAGGDVRPHFAATDRRCGEGVAKIDEVRGGRQVGRVRGRDERLRQVDAGQPPLVALRPVDLRPRAPPRWHSSEHGLAPRDDRGEGRAPRARPDDRDARAGHQRDRRGLGAAPRRDGLDLAPSALFLRRGSLTDARSRNTRRIGVPSKPNASRSRFSR